MFHRFYYPGRHSKTSLPRADICQPFRLKLLKENYFVVLPVCDNFVVLQAENAESFSCFHSSPQSRFQEWRLAQVRLRIALLEFRRAMPATCRFDGNARQAIGAVLRGRYLGHHRLGEPVHLLDHHEDGQRWTLVTYQTLVGCDRTCGMN